MITALSLMIITSVAAPIGGLVGLRGPICVIAIGGATVGCWAFS